MQQHEFVAGGHRLSAWSWGRVDGTRPVVVMLHGGLDSPAPGVIVTRS
jgi:hypothetical protein